MDIDIAKDPVASPQTITRAAAKALAGGVADADKLRVWMPKDYGDASAYHLAGVVYVGVSCRCWYPYICR